MKFKCPECNDIFDSKDCATSEDEIIRMAENNEIWVLYCECGKKYSAFDNIVYKPPTGGTGEVDKLFPDLKLFVWTGFSPDYTDGLAFAIAENAEQAMKLVEDDRGFEVHDWGKLSIYELNTPFAKSVSGGQ